MKRSPPVTSVADETYVEQGIDDLTFLSHLNTELLITCKSENDYRLLTRQPLSNHLRSGLSWHGPYLVLLLWLDVMEVNPAVILGDKQSQEVLFRMAC